MFKKNGFTLIEVIVSIALLGIIALGFLGALNNNLNFLKINKEMTADVFSDQKDMELEIQQTKADIKSGTISSGSLTTLNNVFENGISVKTYQLKYVTGKQDIYTLVTDARLPEFKVPIAINVNAQLRKNTTVVNTAYAAAETNVLGSSSIDSTTADVFMINNYNWYVSRPGFNIPLPSTVIPEIEIGNKYPKFPEDYSIIPTSVTTNLTNVTAYPGRHIVFAVTPAAKSGKMGKTVPSNPVFISGLPPIAGTDLFLHLDASVVSNTDTAQVIVSGSDLMVQKWNDLSVNVKNAMQSTSANRPKLKEHPVGGDFVGKFVDFDAGKTLAVQHNTITNATLNVFAVVRGNDAAVFYNNGTKSIAASGVSIGGSSGVWKIVTDTYTTSNRDFTLGNSDVDVAELIIYKGAMTEADKKAVNDYLKEKYIPLVTVGKIVQLRPLTDVEIIKDEPYSLSFAVLAEMEYGSDRFVPVNWVPNAVSTSAVGTYNFTATAVSDATKSVTLKVIVKDRVYVSSVSLNVSSYTIRVGESFDLNATILPTDATNKAITWTSSNNSVATVSPNGISGATVNALTAGTATITVTTADGNKTATCVVTVKNQANLINVVSAKYLVDVVNTSESSNKVIITFSEPIKLISTLAEFRDGTIFNFPGYNKTDITNVVKSTTDNKSIIVTLQNDIYTTVYPGTKTTNKLSNDSIQTEAGNEVNIGNKDNFTIENEILKYNSSNRYRILMDSFAIDVSGQKTGDGAEIIIWGNKGNADANQLWYLTSVTSVDNFAHTLHWASSSGNRYLGVDTVDGLIYQRSSNSGNQFRWVVERYRNETTKAIIDYTIRPINYSNRFLGVSSKAENQRLRLIDTSKPYRWQINKY